MMSLTFGLFTQVSGSGPLGPLVCSFETVFPSVSDRLPKREKEKKKIDERKNVKTTFTRTYCKRIRPFSYYYPN